MSILFYCTVTVCGGNKLIQWKETKFEQLNTFHKASSALSRLENWNESIIYDEHCL